MAEYIVDFHRTEDLFRFSDSYRFSIFDRQTSAERFPSTDLSCDDKKKQRIIVKQPQSSYYGEINSGLDLRFVFTSLGTGAGDVYCDVAVPEHSSGQYLETDIYPNLRKNDQIFAEYGNTGKKFRAQVSVVEPLFVNGVKSAHFLYSVRWLRPRADIPRTDGHVTLDCTLEEDDEVLQNYGPFLCDDKEDYDETVYNVRLQRHQIDPLIPKRSIGKLRINVVRKNPSSRSSGLNSSSVLNSSNGLNGSNGLGRSSSNSKEYSGRDHANAWDKDYGFPRGGEHDFQNPTFDNSGSTMVERSSSATSDGPNTSESIETTEGVRANAMVSSIPKLGSPRPVGTYPGIESSDAQNSNNPYGNMKSERNSNGGYISGSSYSGVNGHTQASVHNGSSAGAFYYAQDGYVLGSGTSGYTPTVGYAPVGYPGQSAGGFQQPGASRTDSGAPSESSEGAFDPDALVFSSKCSVSGTVPGISGGSKRLTKPAMPKSMGPPKSPNSHGKAGGTTHAPDSHGKPTWGNLHGKPLSAKQSNGRTSYLEIDPDKPYDEAEMNILYHASPTQDNEIDPDAHLNSSHARIPASSPGGISSFDDHQDIPDEHNDGQQQQSQYRDKRPRDAQPDVERLIDDRHSHHNYIDIDNVTQSHTQTQRDTQTQQRDGRHHNDYDVQRDGEHMSNARENTVYSHGYINASVDNPNIQLYNVHHNADGSVMYQARPKIESSAPSTSVSKSSDHKSSSESEAGKSRPSSKEISSKETEEMRQERGRAQPVSQDGSVPFVVGPTKFVTRGRHSGHEGDVANYRPVTHGVRNESTKVSPPLATKGSPGSASTPAGGNVIGPNSGVQRTSEVVQGSGAMRPSGGAHTSAKPTNGGVQVSSGVLPPAMPPSGVPPTSMPSVSSSRSSNLLPIPPARASPTTKASPSESRGSATKTVHSTTTSTTECANTKGSACTAATMGSASTAPGTSYLSSTSLVDDFRLLRSEEFPYLELLQQGNRPDQPANVDQLKQGIHQLLRALIQERKQNEGSQIIMGELNNALAGYEQRHQKMESKMRDIIAQLSRRFSHGNVVAYPQQYSPSPSYAAQMQNGGPSNMAFSSANNQLQMQNGGVPSHTAGPASAGPIPATAANATTVSYGKPVLNGEPISGGTYVAGGTDVAGASGGCLAVPQEEGEQQQYTVSPHYMKPVKRSSNRPAEGNK